MFIIFALLLLGLVLYLSLQHWLPQLLLSPHSIQTQLKKCSAHLSLHEWEEAKKELLPLLKKEKGGKETLLLHIQILRGTNHLEEALKEVSAASKKYPEELLFRLEEGKILVGLKRFQEALETFNVCAPILRTETDLIFYASAHLHSGHPHETLAILDPLLKITQNGEIYSLAADALAEKNLWQEALVLYKNALALGYQKHHIWIQIGHAQRYLGKREEAEKIFRTLLDKDSSDIEATLGLGATLQDRGSFHRALLTYQSVPAWNSQDTRLLKQAALCALHTKKYHFAEKYFKQVVETTPPTAEVYTLYGYSLECQEKWGEAEAHYLKMIHLFPQFPQGYLSLAWLYGAGVASFSSEQGLYFAHCSLKLKNSITAWEVLSACEARKGNFKKAYQIQESLSLSDEDRESRFFRQEALRSLRKNIPFDPLLLKHCSKRESLLEF